MLWSDVERIRAQAPLIHNITNYVVMNTTANALLALGASPVMAHALEEAADLAAAARALVLNIGTLSPSWVDAMMQAGVAARSRGIPIVLDPVGCGATRYRTETALRLASELRPAIIRGNGGEIRALAGVGGGMKGVDSAVAAKEAVDAARALSARWNCVVCVSGAVDRIVGPAGEARVANGHPMMPRVTGLGCTASALTGAFAAVNPSPLEASAHAMTFLGVAGEMAGAAASGPGSFQTCLLDALFRIGREDLEQRARLTFTGPGASLPGPRSC